MWVAELMYSVGSKAPSKVSLRAFMVEGGKCEYVPVQRGEFFIFVGNIIVTFGKIHGSKYESAI